MQTMVSQLDSGVGLIPVVCIYTETIAFCLLSHLRQLAWYATCCVHLGQFIGFPCLAMGIMGFVYCLLFESIVSQLAYLDN